VNAILRGARRSPARRTDLWGERREARSDGR